MIDQRISGTNGDDPDLQHHVVRGVESFLRLKTEWNALLEKSTCVGRVFYRREWMAAWLELRGARYDPLIILIYSGQRLVAILPLCAIYSRLPWTTVTFLGGEDAGYHEMIVDPQVPPSYLYPYIGQVISGLRRAHPYIFLENIPASDPLLPLLTLTPTMQKSPCAHWSTRLFYHGTTIAALFSRATCAKHFINSSTWERYATMLYTRQAKSSCFFRGFLRCIFAAEP